MRAEARLCLDHTGIHQTRSSAQRLGFSTSNVMPSDSSMTPKETTLNCIFGSNLVVHWVQLRKIRPIFTDS